MEIEGVRLANADTLEGRRVHRNVDKPSLSADSLSSKRSQSDKSSDKKLPTKDETYSSESDQTFIERKLTVRSLTLTNEELRLTASLDLTEIEGNNAVPVEYRKGSPRQIASTERNDDGWSLTDEPPPSIYEPWKTDLIQVVLQAILLEKAGYSVPKGSIYYAQKEGTKIGVRGESLRFTDAAGKVVRETPIANIEEIALLGDVQISTQAVHTLCSCGVPILYASSVGRPIAFIAPLDSTSAITRRSQVLEFEKESRRLELTKAIITAKIENQRTLLTRNHPDLPSNVPRLFSDTIQAVKRSSDVDEIRGREGYAAKLYFERFGELFKSEEGKQFQANGRMRRPALDSINATLSFGYSMLVHECTSALRLARLAPALGAFHVASPGRPALSLDLMEPFRILIADSVAVSAFNRKELSAGHFTRTAAGCMTTEYGRRAFFSSYGRRMETEMRHPFFGYKLSYRRMISLHAKMIALWLRGEIETLSFLTTR